MKFHKTGAAVVALMLLVSSCATTNQPASTADASNTDTALRCGALGLGGAALGALIGGKSGAVKGAVVGLAACAVIEIASRQTKSSAQVDQQYKAVNNTLPQQATLVSYQSTVTPAPGVAVRSGDPIKVQSTITAISGTQEPIQEVKETLVAYAPDGGEFKRGEKKVNDSTGSGEYVNSFTLRLPSGAPQGVYRVDTGVQINGHPVGQIQTTNVQVAANGTQALVAAR